MGISYQFYSLLNQVPDELLKIPTKLRSQFVVTVLQYLSTLDPVTNKNFPFDILIALLQKLFVIPLDQGTFGFLLKHNF